ATVGVPLTLAATAASPWGIAAVDFYSSALLLGTDSNAPYALTLSGVVPGFHTFTAVAHDSSSLSTTSAPVTVNVVGSPPATLPMLGLTLGGGPPQLQINGPAGYFYLVEAATNLTIWNTLFATNPSALPFIWQDPNTNAFVQRFYRVRLGP
ncbi:MAG: Ig-like domain-containing protein, partial [Verrucomicrobiota bacterium]